MRMTGFPQLGRLRHEDAFPAVSLNGRYRLRKRSFPADNRRRRVLRQALERTFSWFGRDRRLAKDLENPAETLATFITLPLSRGTPAACSGVVLTSTNASRDDGAGPAADGERPVGSIGEPSPERTIPRKMRRKRSFQI
jgi:hypothetical protein